MLIIIGIDALEYELVNKFNSVNLKQDFFGKTDISDFSEPRTMVLWSSFMTGENKESEVLEDGNKEMWNKKWDASQTFFSNFKNPLVLDLPGYSYNLETHEKSRELLKKFFLTEDAEEKSETKKQYNKDAFEHHKNIRKEFFDALEKNENDLVIGYFSIADVIGHLNFGNELLMKMIYKDLDEIAAKAKATDNKVLILSDHGMKAIGMFGDHSEYGFWSSNFEIGKENPKITDFYSIIEKVI
jgi:hypothetical protein